MANKRLLDVCDVLDRTQGGFVTTYIYSDGSKTVARPRKIGERKGLIFDAKKPEGGWNTVIAR